MWPFFERKKQAQEIPSSSNSHINTPRARPMKFARLVEDMGDFRDLCNHDSALKFWLPEAANEALDEMANRANISMSESLRQLFAAHCYGIYAYQLMIDRNPSIFRDPARPMFSRASAAPPPGKKRVDTYWVPELGKNVMPVKVWIPTRIRSDLQMLADHVEIKLSQYVREIVIARLLGHGTLPLRPKMLNAEPLPAIEDWCEDLEIPKRQVDESEYDKYPLGERRTEWVDE